MNRIEKCIGGASIIGVSLAAVCVGAVASGANIIASINVGTVGIIIVSGSVMIAIVRDARV